MAINRPKKNFDEFTITGRDLLVRYYTVRIKAKRDVSFMRRDITVAF